MNGGPRLVAALAGAIVTSALLCSLWTGVASAGRHRDSAVPGQIEICKAPDNGAAGSSFNFTISNSKGSQSVPVTGGTCSSAIDMPQGNYAITEDLSSGLWAVQSIAVQPASAWLSETDKRGLVKVSVVSGAETQVTFTDSGAAATIKVCKWTSSPTLVGNQYSFSIGTQTVTATAGKSQAAANCSAAVSTQPGTRLTITENTPAGQQVANVSAGGNLSLTSQKGSVIKATAGSGANILYVDNEPTAPAQTGFVEICKEAYDPFVSGSFHFELTTTTGTNLDVHGNGANAPTGEDILVGQCSGPIKVPVGNVLVTETPAPNTQVQSIYAADPSTLGLTNLVNGSAVAVVPVSSDSSNEVQLHFVNKTPTSPLKICKYLPAGSEALAGQMFNFTVTDDAYPANTAFKLSIVASAGTNGACKIVTDATGKPVQFPLGSTATAVEANTDQFVDGGNGAGMNAVQTATIVQAVTNTISFTNVALGQLEICKRMIAGDSSLGQTFTFTYVNTVNPAVKGTVKVLAGACSLPQVVPAGNYTITEDLSKLTVALSATSKAPAFSFVASDARGPFDDNRCVPSKSTPDNVDVPVLGTIINTNCGNPLTVSVPYFNSLDPVRFGETLVTVWNKQVRGSVKLCKVVTSDSTASLGGMTFHMTWSLKDGSDNGTADLTPGTCSGIMGNFAIAIQGPNDANGNPTLVSNVVTVKETTPVSGSYVSSLTLTGGQPIGNGFGTGFTPAQGAIPYTAKFNPGPGTNVATFTDTATPAH